MTATGAPSAGINKNQGRVGLCQKGGETRRNNAPLLRSSPGPLKPLLKWQLELLLCDLKSVPNPRGGSMRIISVSFLPACGEAANRKGSFRNLAPVHGTLHNPLRITMTIPVPKHSAHRKDHIPHPCHDQFKVMQRRQGYTCILQRKRHKKMGPLAKNPTPNSQSANKGFG